MKATTIVIEAEEIRHGVNINQNLLQITLDFEVFMTQQYLSSLERGWGARDVTSQQTQYI